MACVSAKPCTSLSHGARLAILAMTPAGVYVVTFSLAVGLLRGIFQYGRPQARVTEWWGGPLDTIALAAVVLGFVVPIVWATTHWLRFADLALPRTLSVYGVLGMA